MKKYSAFLSPLLLAACTQLPPAAYYNHGSPESLLDVSSEVVTVNFSGGGMDELTGWIDRDAPSRAELFCTDNDPACGRAKQVLSQFAISFHQTPEPRNTAALYYERVAARDCENRYIDNSINPYNLSSITSGCSVAANMVQMVSDKREFINPALLDYSDGEMAGQVYRGYETTGTSSASGASGGNGGGAPGGFSASMIPSGSGGQ